MKMKIKTHLIFCLLFLASTAMYLPGEEPLHTRQTNRTAFTANLEGNWDIFTADMENGTYERLTHTSYDETEIEWIDNKSRILYSTANGGIYLIDVSTKKSREITIEGSRTKITSPFPSPRSRQIIYVHYKPDSVDDTQLFIYDLEKEKNHLFHQQNAPLFYPQWSPDGKYIVYTAVHCSMTCGRIIQELWIAHAEGTFGRQLLMTNSLCMQPVWSPDSKNLAFSSDKEGNFDIWALSLENFKLTQITSHAKADTSPAWSPDGEKIAFISSRNGKMKIWIKNLKTGNIAEFSPLKDKGIEYKDIIW